MKTIIKRLLCAAAAAVLCLCALTGCKASGGGGRSFLRETPASSAEEKHTHEYGDWVTVVEPTCTEPGEEERTCSCGKTKERAVPALGHTTQSGICTRCGENIGEWEIRNYIDEFGNPTGEPYISTKHVLTGTCKDSLGYEKDLSAQILVDNSYITIMLWEYGDYKVRGYINTKYNVVILDGENKKHYTSGILYENDDRITMEDFTILELLIANEKLDIYIEENDGYGYTESYLFSVEADNFQSCCMQLIDSGGDM